ncbi:hypothetical protein AMAG_11845 [Allomyces macrogynus ATCC 38327]|uniref:Uncharacterized protein n=1 Tax=Allomyces macrogynus (strain ATCC 38327) TaxID=578462 RepID=A0A0L0SY02_ALLM3|nr:hypothetical protein AMAG_11845 [Allomyces macrogynus ATCC 38327]|eukprot:KNE67376.1 hypothetical protein AMAG_11845 [Allomyces macrogynus ATCC 38327]
MLDTLAAALDPASAVLASALAALWLSTPPRDTDALAFRAHRARHQALASTTRNRYESAVFRHPSTPHGLPLAQVPAIAGRAKSLWEVVETGLRGNNGKGEVVGEDGERIGFDAFLGRIVAVGSALTLMASGAPVVIALPHISVASESLFLACLRQGIPVVTPTALTSTALDDVVAVHQPRVLVVDASLATTSAARNVDHVLVVGEYESLPKGATAWAAFVSQAASATVVDATPVPGTDKTRAWCNDVPCAEALAAVAGLTGHWLRDERPLPGEVAAIDVGMAADDVTTRLLLWVYLAHGTSIHITPLTFPTTAATHIVLPTTRAASLAADIARTARSLSWPTSSFITSHIRAVTRARTPLPWRDLAPLTRWACSSLRALVGPNTRTLIQVGTPVPFEDYELVAAATTGVTWTRVWSPTPQSVPVAMSAGAAVPAIDDTDKDVAVGSVLPHVEAVLKAKSDEVAARRVGEVSVRTMARPAWRAVGVDGCVTAHGVLRVAREVGKAKNGGKA